ncbi:polyglutamate biosynthesis protein [Penicillium subrubescens]|uniref:Capsule synthesis protein CapA domain-containing protein n=1 Tax=Penicillium subrubescens TaxID=1316194 RepID=A0A1Q5UHQ8_9EURO|nr:polyglutamate biosynthesis protein [Penicillium subrubescens]KAJ5900967.1 polyglutamate biosynthesis protein [Penicillium subrubescens]OKP12020.1 hypothetical protein PENSUB_2378 [Penicillium subrubescens]
MTDPATSFTLSFVGDVMLGRLIDQFFPEHVHDDNDRHSADHFIEKHPSILAHGNYTPSSPWGTTLPFLRASDLFLINLETSATTTSELWPDKVFNYRMHPSNLAPILHAAHVDYASLANNHTLDFGNEGLIETAWTLRNAGVAFAGAGESPDQAFKPAVLYLPRAVQEMHARRVDGQKNTPTPSKEQTTAAEKQGYLVHVYSAADHPRDWASIPAFHLIDYSPATRTRLRTLLLSNGSRTRHPPSQESQSQHTFENKPESDTYHHRAHHHHNTPPDPPERPALKIFSVHWGPNYRWHPGDRIQSLAHFLIDECEVDIVHGHSSHHVQGVEVYKGGVIIYGCGDFVDDYALNREFRNDLGAVWRVVVKEEDKAEKNDGKGKGKGKEKDVKGRLVLDRLEIFPTGVDKFRAMLLDRGAKDHRWVRKKVEELSLELGTKVRKEAGDQGQIIVDIHG